MGRPILITGATGNVGRKLRAYFAADPAYEVRAICLNPEDEPGVATADLSVADPSWAKLFAGIDSVVHLAGDPRPSADWGSIQRANIDLTLNVYEAARAHRVRRVVFASSNWVMGGYRFTDDILTTELPPRPINAYGASKLFGERAGVQLWQAHGVSFVALRLGYCQRGENRPGPHMGYGLWGQQMWLSDRDACHGFERAVLAEGVGGAVLNLMSANHGMRWDLSATEAAIGYRPTDGCAPIQQAGAERGDAWASSAIAVIEGLGRLVSTRQ